MESKITIYERSLELVKSIIKDVFKNESVRVILFGSRARGDYLQTSGIDVGILPGEEMNKGKIALLRERIENSNIPYKIDVVDLSQTSKEFTDRVLEEGLLLWKS